MENFELKIDRDEQIISDFVSLQNEKFFKLHEWQENAIKFFFEHDCKVLYEVTTGAGKSICAIEIMKRLMNKYSNMYVLIIVPKNVILEKMWFPELQKHGFSLKDVGVYYGESKEGCRITITNMQNVLKLPLKLYDLVIFDEIHNYATKRLISLLHYPFKYKIGLSATLERLDKQHWHILEGFNYNIFKYTPKEALDDGVLNNFNFYNIGVYMENKDYDEYLKLTQELTFILESGGGFYRIMSGKAGMPVKMQMLKKMNERKQLVLNYPAKFNILKKLCKQHINDKTLVFNEYNIQTSRCYWYLLEEGIKAKILHSEIKKDERQQILNDYSNNKFNILLATKILDEGYNVPAISAGIIMAGNATAKQCIQRLGRVLRKKETMSSLYQIYIKNTMEEEQAQERAKIFEELCTEYKEYKFIDGGLIEV